MKRIRIFGVSLAYISAPLYLVGSLVAQSFSLSEWGDAWVLFSACVAVGASFQIATYEPIK
jgi:hypothetical protein